MHLRNDMTMLSHVVARMIYGQLEIAAVSLLHLICTCIIVLGTLNLVLFVYVFHERKSTIF